MINEFVTENGTVLYWEVNYDKGGTNAYSGKTIERGFYLSVKRDRNRFRAFEDLTQEYGAVRRFVHPVGRYSDKQHGIAMEVAYSLLPEIANRYNL